LGRPGRRPRSEEGIADLRFVAAFARYSFRNVVLIAAQCPHVTYVTGIGRDRTWVVRSARASAIRIFGYSTKKVAGTDPDTVNP